MRGNEQRWVIRALDDCEQETTRTKGNKDGP